MRPLLSALVLLLALLAPDAGHTQERRVVGYYPSWMRWSHPPAEIDYAHLTHIAHAFVWPGADGSIRMDPNNFSPMPELVSRAHANGVRVVVAVGGYGAEPTAGFAAMAADPTARARFVADLVAFCQTHGYDGADLDWEYPTTADRANFVALAAELSAAFRAQQPALTLSAAIPSVDWRNSYDVPGLRDAFDWFGVMTYDYHGSWTAHAGHNSPLYVSGGDPEGAIDTAVRGWRQKGIPDAKLLPGFAFYGREFVTSGLYAAATGGGAVTYVQALERRAAGWTYHWDAAASVPYLQNADQTRLVTFDDTTSIRIKSAYVRDQGLGGAILWALGHDDVAVGRQPLLATVGGVLRPAAVAAAEALETSRPTLEARPSPFRDRTVLAFDLDRAGPVELRVYDATGRLVARLANRAFPAGRHEVEWAARGVPAGAYLATLRVEGRIERRPLVRVGR